MNMMRTVMWVIIAVALLGQSSASVIAQNNLFNMSYLYFGTINSYVDQVNVTKGSLDVVSPSYFNILSDGELDVTTRLQTTFIDKMHRQGIRVVPFLSNHWDKNAGINGLKNRDKLAKDIAAAIEKYNLDGVNVDIEGVGVQKEGEGVGLQYRYEHTDLIRLLREYLPENKEISVAVAANPNGWKEGWHGFYDYKGISEHADYLMIMAYDESWESPESPVGPVASISFSERSIQYALDQGVPNQKIVYGMPFYGRIWKLDGRNLNNKLITGKGLSSTTVESIVERFNGKVQFDEDTQSTFATISIPEGEHYPIGSAPYITLLTEGEYIVWYENERSLKAKLRLPNKYGIKGTGSWALRHETPDTWDYYSLWLNGHYFVDLSLARWAEEHIHFVSQNGWMTGISSTEFGPGQKLTRAQGAVILIRALGQENLTPKEYKFSDISRHWARKEVELARELGYVQGKGGSKYEPDVPLTREELSQILYNIFDYQYEGETLNPFKDLSESDWSYESIMGIYQKGYITGYKAEDGTVTFQPKESSSRAEMAALMERMKVDIEKKQKKVE